MKFLTYVPKSYLSWGLGHLARLPLPRPLARFSISLFAQAYCIDPTLATKPLESFNSIGAFFTRDLRVELRPIGEGLVCPVDGTLRSCSDISPNAEVTQVKGKLYKVSRLLGEDRLAAQCLEGQLWNFYLSPQDAHHIHSPVDGKIVRTVHIPGKLWPVNDWALNSIEGLFVTNERVITFIESDLGLIAVVMIGATNVGRIKLAYAAIETNRYPWRAQKQTSIEHAQPIVVARGDKLGTFKMGSSVVVVSERKLFNLAGAKCPAKVQYGRILQDYISEG